MRSPFLRIVAAFPFEDLFGMLPRCQAITSRIEWARKERNLDKSSRRTFAGAEEYAPHLEIDALATASLATASVEALFAENQAAAELSKTAADILVFAKITKAGIGAEAGEGVMRINGLTAAAVPEVNHGLETASRPAFSSSLLGCCHHVFDTERFGRLLRQEWL